MKGQIKLIEVSVVGIAALCGDYTGTVLLTVKAAKDAIFKINEKRISNKQKRDEIKSEITTILRSSNLNNDLKAITSMKRDLTAQSVISLRVLKNWRQCFLQGE